MDDFSVAGARSAGQPETRVLTIRGGMTIEHGAEIKTALTQALAAGNTLLLDLEQVTEIDLVGLQFVCAAHRAANIQKKRLLVKKSGNEMIEATAQTAGFIRHMGCAQDVGHTCVWLKGGK